MTTKQINIMALSDIKLALLFTIAATVSISSTNGQLFTIATRLAEVIPLLENVTDTSATMRSFLPHLMSLLKNQEDVQILTNLLLRNNIATADEVASILPVIEGILQSQQDKQEQVVTLLSNQQENHNQTLTLLQNQQDTLNQMASTLNQSTETQTQILNTQTQMANTQTQMANTQTQMANTQTQMANTQTQMANTQTQMANTLTQMVNLLQMQSHQFENITASITQMVGQLNTQNQIISYLPRDIPRDCSDIVSRGPYSSGLYTIQPWDDLGSFPVYCDMDIDGGGWTVFQRRFDGTVDFYLGWDDYEDGFGSLNGEYWMGLGQLHRLTQQGSWSLRIDLQGFDGNVLYAKYRSFAVGDAESDYALSISGYTGNAGSGLSYHNHRAFYTKDSDTVYNCAQSRKGAWWYSSCTNSNLNGLYLGPSQYSETGMWWQSSHESLQRSEMKVRRVMVTN